MRSVGGGSVAAGQVEVLADLGEATQEVAGGRHRGAGGPGVGGNIVDVQGRGGVGTAGIGAASDEDLVVERAGGGPVGAERDGRAGSPGVAGDVVDVHGRRRGAVEAADGVDFAVPIGGGGSLADGRGRGRQGGPDVGGDVIAQERAGDGEAAIQPADEVEVGGGLDEAVAQLRGTDPGGDRRGGDPGTGRRHWEGAGRGRRWCRS